MWKSVVRPADIALSFTLWMAAVVSRIALGDSNAPDFASYIKFGLVIGFATSITFTKAGLYNSFQSRSLIDELFRVLRANVFAILIFILFVYFFAPDRISRGSLLIYLALSSAAFIIERVSIRSYLRRARANDRNRRNVVLVGNGSALNEYVTTALARPELGVRPVGWLDAQGAPVHAAITPFASPEQLRASGLPVDAFVVSYASGQSERIETFLKQSYNDLVQIFVLPDLSTYAFLGLRLEDLGGVPVLALNQPRWSATDIAIKRAIDIFGAGVGLAVLSPFLAVIALFVKLTSSGEIFFGQDRMGLDGQTFKMWKFRTMKSGPAQPGWTIENDPRRTRVGTFLRATSLDELPQLWNVFAGQMSLVGPRPEQPYFVENFRKEIPAYMLRHKMKAGITGWAQVNGWRGDTSLHKRIECDLYYIRNWSVGLDIKILLLTFWRGFIHRNAY